MGTAGWPGIKPVHADKAINVDLYLYVCYIPASASVNRELLSVPEAAAMAQQVDKSALN